MFSNTIESSVSMQLLAMLRRSSQL